MVSNNNINTKYEKQQIQQNEPKKDITNTSKCEHTKSLQNIKKKNKLQQK